VEVHETLTFPAKVERGWSALAFVRALWHTVAVSIFRIIIISERVDV